MLLSAVVPVFNKQRVRDAQSTDQIKLLACTRRFPGTAISPFSAAPLRMALAVGVALDLAGNSVIRTHKVSKQRPFSVVGGVLNRCSPESGLNRMILPDTGLPASLVARKCA